MRASMDAELLLKNNRNVVPNIGDGKGGMELRFGTSVLGECGLDGITSSSGGLAGLCVTVC